MNAPNLTDWIGNSDVRHQRLEPWPVAALSALFDLDDPAAEAGRPLPPMWHWLYFLPSARRSETGEDGFDAWLHAARVEVLEFEFEFADAVEVVVLLLTA